jgi:uncharacterized protein (DUF488 family)
LEIATIGFTQSSARDFFERLKRAGIRRLLDVRLNNVSQLAGFAKASDLSYFLQAICQASYEHDLRLAPTKALLDAYRKKSIDWTLYETQFRNLMTERNVPEVLDPQSFQMKTVLLCSEHESEKCHRRIVAELLAARLGGTVEHL